MDIVVAVVVDMVVDMVVVMGVVVVDVVMVVVVDHFRKGREKRGGGAGDMVVDRFGWVG